MREYMVPALFLLLLSPASAQVMPEGWKPIKDAKGACQIAVPPEWTLLSESTGAAFFHDPSTAIAVVTSQPAQAFKPLSDSMVKLLDLPKDKMFENSPKRLFYQEKTSRGGEDTSAHSSSVPAGSGTCSCHIVFAPSITAEVARKIAMSLGPAAEGTH